MLNADVKRWRNYSTDGHIQAELVSSNNNVALFLFEDNATTTVSSVFNDRG